MPDAINALSGPSESRRTGAAGPVTGRPPEGREAEGRQGEGARESADGFQGSQELEELEQEKKARENQENPDEQTREEELKALEEKIKATEQKLQEALRNNDPFEALALMNELNSLNRQRENLTGQSTGPDLTESGMGLNNGGGGAPPAGGGGAPPMGGGGAPPMGGGGAPPMGGGGAPPMGGGGAPPMGGGGGAAPAGNTTPPSGPPPEGAITPNGTGQDAVDLARQYEGHNSIDIKGRMPHFTAAGGQTNNCADFVSSALEATGRVRGHHINVREFERSLQAQGYVQVPASQARPGDVWINHSRGHTELVSTRGATHTIGSNNDRPGHQVISERPKAPGSGVIYQLPERP